MPQGHRNERLGDLIRTEISQIIQREIKDPRVQGLVSVTDVELTEDLRYARIFVSVLGSEEERKATMKTLRHATGFIRHLLGERLSVRFIPEIDIRYDEGIERGDRMLQLLRQVAEEDAARQAETAEPEKPRRRARITYHTKKE